MIKRVYQVMLGYIATIVFSYCTFYYWNFIDIDNWLHRSSLCHNPPFSEELRKYWFSFFCVVLSHLAVCLYRSIRLDWTKIALTDICTVAFLGIESISVGLAYISPFQTTCVDFLGVESSPFIWLSWVSCVPILFMLANLGFKSEDSAIECILLSGTAMTLLAFQNISLPYIPIVSALVSTHWLSFAISSVTFSLAIVRLQQAMRLKLQKAQLAFDAINESKRDDLTNQAVVYDLKSSQAGCKVANRLSFMLCLFPGLYFLRAGRIFSVETYTMVILITSTMTKVFFATMVNDAQSAALDPRLRGLMEEKKRIETHRNALLRYIFHEVRTPLNSLVLGLQCLADLKVTTSTEQEVLEMMAVGTEQINKTLNDVISFQIIDEGSLVLDFTWFEPSAFLKMLHKNFQSQLDTKRIRLSSTTAKGVPSLIYADRSRIEHVFNNLVSNAIKFSDEDSEIRINLTYETDDSPVVRFSIRDFGKGIAPSDLAILFQPFTMIRPGELGEGRGSGLGLSICKTLVELHNGNLACVSTRRDASMHDNQLSGSEFYFTLPHDPKAVPTPTFTSKSRRSISTRSNTGADSSDSNAKRGSVQTPSSSSKSTLLSVQEASRVEPTSVPPHTGIVVERALVVDDVLSNRKMLATLVTKMGITCDMCVDGLDALNTVTKGGHKLNYYQIIFMDFTMPNLNGPDAAAQIRAAGFKNLIVGVTGNSLSDDLMHFEEQGADVALVKPLKAVTLKSLLSYCGEWGVDTDIAQFSISKSTSNKSSKGERRLKNWLLNETH